jgi:polysaccharide export outer membrane protein
MRWLRLLLLLFVLPVAACATTPRPAVYPVDPKGPYTLDSGDVLRVTVYGDKDISTTYKVDDAGAISFPLVGQVPVRGKTTSMAAASIASALARGYMRDPNVSVEVDQYRPFFIQGQVKTAGQYPYVYGMSLRAAISTAGGFSDIADPDHVVVYRHRGSMVDKSVMSLDAPIQPGDTIVVPERWL